MRKLFFVRRLLLKATSMELNKRYCLNGVNGIDFRGKCVGTATIVEMSGLLRTVYVLRLDEGFFDPNGLSYIKNMLVTDDSVHPID